MKSYILLIVLLCVACSRGGEQSKAAIAVEGELLFVSYNNGREVERKMVTIDAQSNQLVKAWIDSFAELTEKDYNSYAPGVVLIGKGLKVNFLEGITIVSFRVKDDPAKPWLQLSREPTQQDRAVKRMLEASGSDMKGANLR